MELNQHVTTILPSKKITSVSTNNQIAEIVHQEDIDKYNNIYSKM